MKAPVHLRDFSPKSQRVLAVASLAYVAYRIIVYVVQMAGEPVMWPLLFLALIPSWIILGAVIYGAAMMLRRHRHGLQVLKFNLGLCLIGPMYYMILMFSYRGDTFEKVKILALLATMIAWPLIVITWDLVAQAVATSNNPEWSHTRQLGHQFALIWGIPAGLFVAQAVLAMLSVISTNIREEHGFVVMSVMIGTMVMAISFTILTGMVALLTWKRWRLGLAANLLICAWAIGAMWGQW